MDNLSIAVILAGGKGERFWPLSRRQRPKQFLSLDGSGKSLLQATAERLLALTGSWERVWVVTAAHLEAGVREQLPQLLPQNLLVEPEGRDTAPAVAWTALEAAERYGNDCILGFFPADHWIDDAVAFGQTIGAAATLAAERQAIVTLGVVPGYAATGYGYIEQGERVEQFGVGDASTLENRTAYQVARFTEKPDRQTAEAFLASGRFSWNSGMFIFRAGVALAEIRTYAPELYQALSTKGVAAYPELQKTSIDYALMEKTELAYVIPASFSWDDLGDWNGVERLHKKDQENVELAHHIGHDTKDGIFYNSNNNEIIVTIGLEDVVVVRDGDVTLVVNKNRTQDIKKVVKSLYDKPELSHLL